MSAPTTRFSTELLADGCTKRVVSPAPMENFCQLMIAPLLACTFSWPAPGVDMPACPLTTTPPCGSAHATVPKAS